MNCVHCGAALPHDWLILTSIMLREDGYREFRYCSEHCVIFDELDALEIGRLRYRVIEWLLRNRTGAAA